MAFQITSDTIVKVLVRRGQEYDRLQTLLTNGELGYSQDTARLFIGDGITLGGNPVSNLFYGFVANKANYTSLAQPGDTLFQTADNTLYAFNGLTDTWQSIHPVYGNFFTSYTNRYDVNPNALAGGLVYTPSNNAKSIYSTNNVLDFNAYYWSLCAGYSSFYFGNIYNKTVSNNLSATVNVAQSLYINGADINPNQIQILAKDGTGNSLIQATQNYLNINGQTGVNFYTNGYKNIVLNAGSNFTFTPSTTGTYASPNFYVRGVSRYADPAYYDSNVTVNGSLSVLGSISYLQTNVTTTSALSVVTSSANVPAMIVSQLASTSNQIIAEFNGATSQTQGRPVLIVRDGPFVGINVSTDTLGTTTNAKFMVSGTAIFGGAWSNESNDAFIVNTGSGGISNTTTGNISNNTNNSITFTAPGGNVGTFTRIANNSTNSTAVALQVDGSSNTQGFKFVPSVSTGSYNTLTQSGDQALIYYSNAGADGAGGLVIGQWSASAKGIRIAANGQVGIGIASPSYQLHVNGTFGVTGNATIAGTTYCTGDVIAFYTSDERLKDNAKPIESALEKVKKISGVEFDWNDKQSTHTGHDVGVLAQQIEAVLPEAVTTRDDGYKAVKYEKIIPLLIEAIKELSK